MYARSPYNDLSLTYGESRTIDDIPDVWERVTLGLPR